MALRVRFESNWPITILLLFRSGQESPKTKQGRRIKASSATVDVTVAISAAMASAGVFRPGFARPFIHQPRHVAKVGRPAPQCGPAPSRKAR